MRLPSVAPILARATVAAVVLLLAACASGPVRRVSEPTARIQQLTVQASGAWTVELRIENFSSIPMRFDSIDLAVGLGGATAGRLSATPVLTIGPESADTVSISLVPDTAAKIVAADALAGRRSVDYTLNGTLAATPEEARQRTYDINRTSALTPAPGLPGVLR